MPELPRVGPAGGATESRTSAPVKVSVVVPVYNPGSYIEACIDSILSQTMPSADYEAIFVDDGSTDQSVARLDRLATERPNVRVIHIPNSGWPGKPRNVGIDAAAGEFIQFLDHDDSLGPEALQRLYDFGVANDADVIIGKMAGRGRTVPRELFRRNRPRATVANAPLIDSLTPHKMFRRSFLDEIGLRFPEGRRRLEDHVFVTEALLRARNVSVLSDYVCYVHIKRSDARNAALQEFDPVGYFGNVREALDIVERYTEPGPVRDRLYRRWLRNEMIERLRGQRMLDWSENVRKTVFTEIHDVAVERFGPGVAGGLPPMQQVVAALIMTNRLDDALALAEWEVGVSTWTRLRDAWWADGAWHIACDAEYVVAGQPMTFRRHGDAITLDPPLSDAGRAGVVAAGAELAMRPDKTKADLVIRERDTAAEFFAPVTCEQELVATDEAAPDEAGPDDSGSHRAGAHGVATAGRADRVRLRLRVDATIDARTAAGGRPLPDGVWEVFVRLSGSGWTKDGRPSARDNDRAVALPRGAVLTQPARVVMPFPDRQGNLAIDVGQRTDHVAKLLARVPSRAATAAGGRLRVELPLHAPSVVPATVRYVGAGSGSGPADIVGELDVNGVLTADLPDRASLRTVTPIDVAFGAADGIPHFVGIGIAIHAPASRPPVVVRRPTAVGSNGRSVRRGRRRMLRLIRRIAIRAGGRTRR